MPAVDDSIASDSFLAKLPIFNLLRDAEKEAQYWRALWQAVRAVLNFLTALPGWLASRALELLLAIPRVTWHVLCGVANAVAEIPRLLWQLLCALARGIAEFFSELFAFLLKVPVLLVDMLKSLCVAIWRGGCWLCAALVRAPRLLFVDLPLALLEVATALLNLLWRLVDFALFSLPGVLQRLAESGVNRAYNWQTRAWHQSFPSVRSQADS